MGKHLKDIYPHATKFQVMRYRFNKFMEKVILVAFFLGIVYGAFETGKMVAESQVTHANVEVVKEVEVKSKELPPVLQRIIKCESGGKHYDKNGQVLMRANNNKTVDIGIGQINEFYWGKKATELGYDLTNEQDNLAFTVWLYENHGTEPYVWSKGCWNR